MRDFTVNNYLLPEVRRLGDFPDDDPRTDDDSILAIANRRLILDMVPMMQSVRANYWLRRSFLDIVSGQRRYRIPNRAIGSSLDSVYYQSQGAGNEFEDVIELQHQSLVEGVETGNRYYYSQSSGAPFGYHVEGDEIVLDSEPNQSAGKLIMMYNRIPNALVKTGTSDVLVVSSVTSTTEVEVTANATFSDGSYTCDVIQSKSNYDSLVDGVSVTKSGTTLTLGSAVTGIAVGDFVCIEGTSPVPQIPREVQDLLNLSVAAEACRNRKDIEMAQLLDADYVRFRGELQKMLAPRVRRQNTKLKSRHSPLNKGYRGGHHF